MSYRDAHHLTVIATALGLVFGLTACGSASGAPAVRNDATRDSPGDGTPAARAVDSRSPTEAEARAIEELADAAQQIRGLSFAAPVPVLVQTRDAITAYVESQIEDDAIMRSRTLYVALGLLPADMDVRAQLLSLLGEQILGYYDAEQKRLVVRDDVMHALGTAVGTSERLEEARLVLLHELVHALQDQHLKLSQNMELDRTSDGENAFRSLVEGDATLAMLGYMFESQGVPLNSLTRDPDRLRGLTQMDSGDPLAGGPQLAQAPDILRVPLLSAYRDGLTFCAFVHGQGGWTALDVAHGNPPITTEHVLHPERWLKGHQPDPIDVPPQAALVDAGYEVVETTSLGELEMGLYFGLAIPPVAAQRAADGWGGDQVRVYRSPDGTTPIVWFTTWDDRKQAAEADTAAQAVIRSLPANSRSQHRIHRAGRAVLILHHVPEALHAPIVRGFSGWAQRLPAAPPTRHGPPQAP